MQVGRLTSPLSTALHDMAQAGHDGLHAFGKSHIVKARIVALHKMHPGFGVFAEVADFAFAMCGQRADRNQPGLETRDQAQQQLCAVADLEDHTVQRLQAHANEGRRQPLGALV